MKSTVNLMLGSNPKDKREENDFIKPGESWSFEDLLKLEVEE